MAYNLIKLSRPSWSKSISSSAELKEELFQHICNICRLSHNVSVNSQVQKMLGTDCGCEYEVEYGVESNGLDGSIKKPVVTFVPPAKFFKYSMNDELTRASVFTLNHPSLGRQQVVTSNVLVVRDNGSFETLNTIYVPLI